MLLTRTEVAVDRDDIVTVTATWSGGPVAVLVRPDGYVAWAADGTERLTAALDHWCGHAKKSVR